jgi:hypothetical protein
MSELDFLTSIRIKFHSLNSDASKEIKNKFLAYINSYSRSSYFECISDESFSVDLEIFSTHTASNICEWFESQLTDNASSLSKNAINHLKNSTIYGHAIVNEHPFYYLIKKEFGGTKLNWHKHINHSLTDALAIVKALELKTNQSINLGNGVVITLLSKNFSRKPKKLEFNITSKDHVFFIMLLISHRRKRKNNIVYIPYFECSGEVFENLHDCINLPYLIDDMLHNIINGHDKQIATNYIEMGRKPKASLKERKSDKRYWESLDDSILLELTKE